MTADLKDLIRAFKIEGDRIEKALRSKDPMSFILAAKEMEILLPRIGQELGLQTLSPSQSYNQQLPLDFPLRQSQKARELDLSIPPAKGLRKSRIHYVEQLIQITESELLKIPNLGYRSVDEIKKKLAQIGLVLAADRDDRPQLERTRLSKQDFANLVRGVEELDLSVRASKCLEQLGIKYIGDLVHAKKEDLLESKNFGRRTFSEINQKLKKMNLRLEMSVANWPPPNIQETIKKLNPQIEKMMARQLPHKNADNLQEEFFLLLSPYVKNNRDWQIIKNHFGLGGNRPKNLASLGKEFQISRERVRQICTTFEKKLIRAKWRKNVDLPHLRRATETALSCLPALAGDIEVKLAKMGISKGPFRLENLITINEFFGGSAQIHVAKVGTSRFAVRPEDKNLPKLILLLARKSVSGRGVATISDVAELVREKTGTHTNLDFLTKFISSLRDFHWLDQSKEWFWLSKVPKRNRLINIITKILSVSPQIAISELRAGAQRHHRMQGFAPPRAVMLELCRQLPWCQVDGSTVTADPPPNWEEVLDSSSTELAMAAILKDHGPIMSRKQFQENCCSELGMSQPAFFGALKYSPIITKYAVGVYGIRGAKALPGTIEALKPKRIPQTALEDYGWTSDGKVWLSHRITRNMLETGVFSVPAGMRSNIQGKFALKTSDGASISTLKAKQSSAWSLTPLFSRRGGDPGDYLVLTFDLGKREAKAYLGQEDLLDQFRPLDETT